MNPEGFWSARSSLSAPRTGRARRLFQVGGGLLLLYLVIAYVVLPLFWRTDVRFTPIGPNPRHHAHRLLHPGHPLNSASLVPRGEAIPPRMWPPPAFRRPDHVSKSFPIGWTGVPPPARRQCPRHQPSTCSGPSWIWPRVAVGGSRANGTSALLALGQTHTPHPPPPYALPSLPCLPPPWMGRPLCRLRYIR